MASANVMHPSAVVRTARQRVDDIMTDLQDALVELGRGPVIAVVSSDHRPTIEFIRSPLPLRGVPPSRWQFQD